MTTLSYFAAVSSSSSSPLPSLPPFPKLHTHHRLRLHPSSSFLPPSFPSLSLSPPPQFPLRSSSSDVFISNSYNPYEPSLKSRLRNGDTLYGLFLLTFSPTLAEIAGLSGYDFVVIDMEHGHGGISDALPCLHALAAARTPAVLRVPEPTSTWAKKALDLGPQGIMFPMIEDPKSAIKAVSYCRFPPGGVRGSAHPIVRASDYGIDPGYLSSYEDELLVMCQIESEDGVKMIDEIAAVDGVDCIQMGPLDLSASMGYLWDPGNKKVREMVRTAEKAVLANSSGAYLAGFAMPHDSPENMRRRGYRMVSGAVDIALFRAAAVEDVKKFKVDLESDYEREKEDGLDDDEKYWSE